MNLSLKVLESLVLKNGVSLGGLSDEHRRLALAVPAACLRPGEALPEAEVNLRLRASLAAESGFLQTDHVELRRWLVDTGWWSRDGYGRAYRRTVSADQPPLVQAVDAALSGLDLADWAVGLRARVAQAREARRAAWQAGQATA